MTNKNNLHCSFCGKSQKEVKKLIAGADSHICNECIDLCNEIMTSENQNEKNKNFGNKNPLTPKEMYEKLNDFIIGQGNAKKSLAVAVYNHYKRLNSKNNDDVKIKKSNVLMIGPTGSGKTLLAETIADMLDVPFAIADATTLTEAGYVGEDVEIIVKKLLQKCDFNQEKAENGIIYIDEIDKISRGSENRSTTKDVGGEGVQQALLKLIEGTVVSIPSEGNRKVPGSPNIEIDTKNILFICGGSFAGIEKILDKENNKSGIGFCQEVKKKESVENISDRLSQVTNETLKNFGLIPELIGRLPVKVALDELTKEQLVQVLTEPKDSVISQYVYLLKMDGKELVFEENALDQIAEISIKNKTGARGLTSILEDILKDVMFDSPSEPNLIKITITKDCVDKKSPPIKEYMKAA